MMRFSELAKYLEKLEETSSRIEITKILSSMFNEARVEEIDKISYLVLGKLAPSYKNIVFNIADRMMLRAVSEAYGRETKEISILYKQKGDIGDVVTEYANSRGRGLSAVQVYERLLAIAQDEGPGSQERKIKEIAKLLKELDSLSARFVARIPIGKLRLGFSDKTILDALSWMKNGDKSAKPKLEKAYRALPDVGALAKKVKKEGIEKATKDISPTLGVPVLPMLAQRIKSPTEMIKKMGKVAVEPKLDGLRIQIHFKAGKNGFIKSYTRNLNETSWMFPELANISNCVKAKGIILDAEAVGLDEKKIAMASFQTTMTRRRKHLIKENASKVPIKFYVFDLLSKDNKNLMDKSYLERRKILKQVIKKSKYFKVVENYLTENPDEISRLNEQKRKEGYEGIMVKKVDSAYIPGRTGWRWVKMKESEKSAGKLSDTVDCIVIGYSVGKGRRAQFGMGQLLVGVRDGEKIKTLSKIGTGITDKQFKEFKKRLTKLEVKKKPSAYIVHKNLEPDYWIEPRLVMEVAADDITKSPTHSSGYALRFPRLVGFRDDKNVNQATTISEVKRLFDMQKV
jgi:DNA ligase-1